VTAPRPYTLVAELTYRCPLRCGYCSNPLDLAAHGDDLTLADWTRVVTEAEALGVMGVNFTGGEPLLFGELAALVAHARSLGLYTSLITSGLPLRRDRWEELVAAGIDHVQLSFQDSDAEGSDRIAGTPSFDTKREVAGWVKEAGLPLTVNVVLHADNVDRVDAIIALAETLRAERLELAHTQYLGWALVNRDRLLPTRAQIDASRVSAKLARARLRGTMEILMVLPDYVAGRPRAWTGGGGGSSSCPPTGSSSPATPRTRSRGCRSTRCGGDRSRTPGGRPGSRSSAARSGCPSHAGAAISEGSITGAAAARRST
jgi:pyrroloquinoline quinone biosynthesis protein E